MQGRENIPTWKWISVGKNELIETWQVTYLTKFRVSQINLVQAETTKESLFVLLQN